MTDLISLAERIEKLEGPCREVDAIIRCAVFAPSHCYVKQSPFNGAWCIYYEGRDGKERGWEGLGTNHLQRCGAFTESLDAAMTLVPEGWVIASLDWWLQRQRSGVTLREVKDFDAVGGYGFGYDETCGDARANSATPALALCSASLRARATTNHKDVG